MEGRVGGPRGLRGRGGVVGGGCVGCEGCEGEGVAGVRVARTGDYEEGGSCGGGVEMGRLVVDSGWGGDIIFCRRAALFGLVGGGVDQSKKPFQTRPARVTIVTTPLPSRKKTQMEQGNDERIASSCVTPGVCSNGNNRGKSVDNFSTPALESEQSRFEISAVSPAKATQKPADIALFIRPENEDDDGYDPYSDRPATTEFFEPNPWD